MEKYFDNKPSFLGSEVGLVLKTITVPATNSNVVTENNRKVVKAGTIITTPYSGLLYNDVDVTDGDNLGSLMYAGYYVDAKLPKTASAQATTFSGHGLYAITEGATTRPAFGTVGLTKIATPTGTASNKKITVSFTGESGTPAGVVGYRFYNSAKNVIATTTEAEYTVSTAGTYYVQAIGDNVRYADSDLSAAITVS